MNEDLLAAMTPETLQAVQQVNQLLSARRKNKPGPGGMSFSLPSLRRMNTKKASEMDGIMELMGYVNKQQPPPAPGMPQAGGPADLQQFMGMLQ